MPSVPLYEPSWSLEEKLHYVLQLQQKGSAAELAAEIMELEGIAAEEAVAELTINVENELAKMEAHGDVQRVKEHRQKVRYALPEGRQ